MLYSSDKKGGHICSQVDLDRFRKFMVDCELLELENRGCKFTWMNNREGDEFIREKLDRAVINTR